MQFKFFQMLEFINTRLTNIEKNINRIDEKVDYGLSLQRNLLIRIKNGEEIDDNAILYARPYNDLTPQKSYSLYKNLDANIIILDVTNKNFSEIERAKGALHIPLEELNTRYVEIPSKTTPILVLSEDGLNSILACEILVRKGHYNVNNVSGGYKFWPKNGMDEKERLENRAS